MEPIYQKRGYLTDDFRLFHLTDIGPQEFTFHYHDFDKIIILLSGKVTYIIEGRSYELRPYDIVLVNHNEIHRPFIDDTIAYERIIIYLSPSFLSSYQTGEWDLGSCFAAAREHGSHVLRMHNPVKPAFLPTILRLEAAIYEDGYANPLYCQVLFLEFLIQLNRASRSQKLDYPEMTACDSRILAILEYINLNLAETINVDILAARFHFSRYHLMRLFKQETGCTIARYITSKRLLAAREMLSLDIPITEICYRCGFQNYSTFSRAYKAEFHEAPRQSRI
ncbi:MAG: helix-turn-helix domain-containing protein [Lachnospiraceae bacterium]